MWTSDRRSLGSACPLYAAILLALVWAGGASAQPPQRAADVADERVAALRRVLSDYGGLTRYGSENTEVPPPRAVQRMCPRWSNTVT